jgi:hypothetical protein
VTRADGHRQLAGLFRPGDMFGLLEVIDGQGMSNNVSARVASTLALVPTGPLRMAMATDAPLAVACARQLAERSRRIYARMAMQGPVPLELRVAAMLRAVAQRYGTPGPDLATAGAQAVHVPYKGTVDAVNALIGRQLDFAMPILQVGLPHVRSGRLTALAVVGPRRNPLLPDVPTLAEAGVPGVSLVSFGGVSVPAGTPAPIVAKLSAAVREVIERPAVRARIEAGGGQPSWSTSQDYTEQILAEIALTGRMMAIARLEPQ